MLVLVGTQHLGAAQVAVGGLRREPPRGVHGDAAGPRVGYPQVEVPPVLVGLAAVEPGALDLDVAGVDPGRDDAEADVAGVEPVVRDGPQRVVEGAQPVRERRGPERGLPRGREVELDGDAAADLAPVVEGEFHEEVVRVLAVVQGLAAVALAGLEQQG